MTEEQFMEFSEVTIHEQLFHVDFEDKDDDSGSRLEEVILVRLIAHNFGCLKYKPLQWFLDTYLTKPQDEMTPFEKREWNYSFEQGMVVKFADDLPADIRVYNEPGVYYYPADYVGKIGIILECWEDIHGFAQGSYYYCKLNFGNVFMTAPAQYFVRVAPKDTPNIK